MAFHRIRLTTALLAVLITLAVALTGSAAAAGLRVEGPRGTIFQGNVRPYVGTLRDQDGIRHTTAQSTALGALVTASRNKPFPYTKTWYDGFGGGWAGFLVDSINGVQGGGSYWVFKVDNVLQNAGAGAVPVTANSHVLFYFTSFDADGNTLPTLGLIGPGHATVGAPLTYTVTKYDDQGVGTPAAGAWVWINGVGTKTDGAGHVTVRLGKPGLFSVRSTLQGTVRSRTLWVRAVTS